MLSTLTRAPSRLAPHLGLWSLLLVGCGPGAALQPLVGETADIQPLLEQPLRAALDDAPTIAARRWVEAAHAGNWALVWDGLSGAVQQLLRARLPSERQVHASGEEVLATLVDTQTPLRAVHALLGFEPIAIFPYPPGVEAETPPDPTVRSAVHVYLYESAESAVALPMEFDGSHWRIAELGASWMSQAASPATHVAKRDK